MNEYPIYIYLQVADGDELDDEFDNDTTWCQDKINEHDIEYVRADLYYEAVHQLTIQQLEELSTEAMTRNSCPHCGDNRTGKGSLIAEGMTFCNELCHAEWLKNELG